MDAGDAISGAGEAETESTSDCWTGLGDTLSELVGLGRMRV